MRPARTVRAAVLAAAVAGSVLVAAPAADAAGRGVVTVHGTKKHTVAMAKTLRPGVVHLRNTGRTTILVVKKRKAGAATLAGLLNSGSAKANKRLYRSYDYVEAAPSRSDSWVKLSRGSYFVAELSEHRLAASRIRVVRVAGHTKNAKLPRAKRITVDRRDRVAAATTITRGSALRVVNRAPHIAYAYVVRIRPSLTDAQARRIVAHPSVRTFVDARAADGFYAPWSAPGPKHTVTSAPALSRGRYFIQVRDSLRPGTVGLLTVR